MQQEGMSVDEAWARVQQEENWTPAWKTWSRQVVRPGGSGGAMVIDLVPPTPAEGGEEVTEEDHEWEEEELESFLQRCEVEAGFIQEVDRCEARRRAEDWRELEAEAAMAGIARPRLRNKAIAAGRGKSRTPMGRRRAFSPPRWSSAACQAEGTVPRRGGSAGGR